MKLNELCKKNIKELNMELSHLQCELFNLRMQVAGGQLQQTYLLKKIRRSIARVKTLLTLKAKG